MCDMNSILLSFLSASVTSLAINSNLYIECFSIAHTCKCIDVVTCWDMYHTPIPRVCKSALLALTNYLLIHH